MSPGHLGARGSNLAGELMVLLGMEAGRTLPRGRAPPPAIALNASTLCSTYGRTPITTSSHLPNPAIAALALEKSIIRTLIKGRLWRCETRAETTLTFRTPIVPAVFEILSHYDEGVRWVPVQEASRSLRSELGTVSLL